VDRGDVEAVGDDPLELLAVVGDAAALAAQGEARPDDEGEGPDLLGGARASSACLTVRDLATSRPILIMACLKSSRSSPLAIASGLAPIISTPYLARMPSLWSSIDRLSAVWPPRVGRSAEGRSAAMIFSRISTVSGSM
jgi:hypothetical protein